MLLLLEDRAELVLRLLLLAPGLLALLLLAPGLLALLLLALGLLALLRLAVLRLALLRPPDAVPRLLLRDDDPDLEEEEELRDAIDLLLCSVG